MEGTVDMAYNRSKINPKKLALWIGIASIIMFFGGLTSAFIVRQAAGNWLEFPMPNQFYISTGLVILSSITIQLAYNGYKKQNNPNSSRKSNGSHAQDK